MTSSSPARRTALLRLLADWKAERCTPGTDLSNRALRHLFEGSLAIPVAWAEGGVRWTLTSDGLAAARREKDATPKEDTRDA